MKIAQTSSRNDETQRVQATGTVDVGELTFGGVSPRQWRPTHIAVTFERHRIDGGDWTDWDVEHLSWSGHVVMRDGSRGVPRSERLRWPVRERFGALGHVREWVAVGMPVGDLPAPVPAET
jgi:hypothetical protein